MCQFYDSDVLFESGTGVKVTFAQLMTLMGVDNIDSRVVDAWSLFLNSLEQYKDPASHSRFYLPNFDVVSYLNFCTKCLFSYSRYIVKVNM